MSDGAEHPSALEEVLTQCFLLREEGREPDLDELCHGDEELRDRAERLLSREPELLRRQGESSSATPLEDDELPSGTRLDEFRILRRIASGGGGTVFLAEQERLGRTVALKVVDRSLMGTPQAWQRLRREASIAASLNHPNIVPVYAIGAEGERGFIAMRYLAGPALNQLELPIEPERAARIALAVARALEAAHDAGAVHRDVKPANIMLEDDVPYLVDFGLARSSIDPTLTSQGSVPGTLPYMAPELLSQPSPALDPRVDVYALGATLYELLAGHPPFEGKEPVVIMRRILLQDPPALELGRGQRDLATIVMQALEKEPRRRFPSARALAEELERFLADEPIISSPTSTLERFGRRIRRQPRLALFAALSMTAVLVLGGVAGLARLGEKRALHSGVELIEGALREGRVEQAHQTVTGLLENHERAGELAKLADLVAAELATDHLFTALYRRPLVLNWDDLDPALGRLRASRATELLETRALPLLAAAEWCLGREEGARNALRQLVDKGGAPLASASIAELLGDEEVEVPETGTSDEHVLRSLILFLLERPYTEQDQEIGLALLANPANPRANYARAVGLAANGQFGRAAQVAEGLVDPRLGARDARRLLVRLKIHTGEFAAARAVLDSIPRGEWGEVEAFHDLSLLLETGEFERFEERLEELRLDYPPPSLLELTAAQYRAQVLGDMEGADALFEELASDSPDPFLRDLAEANQYSVHVDDAIAKFTGAGGGPQELRSLRELGKELWERLESPRAHALVAWKLGLVLLYVGPAGQGFDRLEEAMELWPGDCLLRINYAEHCIGLAHDAPGLIADGILEAGTDRYLMARASTALREALEALERGDAHASEEELTHLATLVTDVSEVSEDWGLLLTARSVLEDAPKSEALQRVLQRAAATFERLYGRAEDKGLPYDDE